MNIRQRFAAGLQRADRVLSHPAARLAGALFCVFIYALQVNEFQFLQIAWRAEPTWLRPPIRYFLLFSPHVGICIILWLAMWRRG